MVSIRFIKFVIRELELFISVVKMFLREQIPTLLIYKIIVDNYASLKKHNQKEIISIK